MIVYRGPALSGKEFPIVSGRFDVERSLGVFSKNDPAGDVIYTFRDQVYGDWDILGQQSGKLAELAGAIIVNKKPNSSEDCVIGITEGAELIKLKSAIVDVAKLAEAKAVVLEDGTPLKYHFIPHTAHVALFAHYLGEISDLRINDRILLVLAAFAHDVAHPGGQNEAGNIFEFEAGSFDAVNQALSEAGVSTDNIEKLRLMLLTTSNDGPSRYLQWVAKAYQAGKAPDHETIKAEIIEGWKKSKTPEQIERCSEQLDKLQRFVGDPALTKLAVLLGASDILPSMINLERSGEDLTAEHHQVGNTHLDFRGPESGKGFLEFLVRPVLAPCEYYIGDKFKPFLNSCDQEINRLAAVSNAVGSHAQIQR